MSRSDPSSPPTPLFDPVPRNRRKTQARPSSGQGQPASVPKGIRTAPAAPDPLEPERRLWQQGLASVAGVDEAGMGPLAGPVVAAAAILPRELHLPGIADSKTLSPQQRAEAAEIILKEAVAVSVAVVDVSTIDRLNIYHAGLEAMSRAVAGLSPVPECVLVDGRRIPDLPFPQQRIVGGDRLSHVIAAASIIAKTTRDRLMDELDSAFPGYGFAEHKGYPTPSHRAALSRLGPCPAHRTSFQAVREYCGEYSSTYYRFRTRIRKANDRDELDRLLIEAALVSPSLPAREFKRLRDHCSRRKQALR
jgi:ribonuclease HII